MVRTVGTYQRFSIARQTAVPGPICLSCAEEGWCIRSQDVRRVASVLDVHTTEQGYA